MAAADIGIHSNQDVHFSSPWGFPLREDVVFSDSEGVDRLDVTKQANRAMQRLHEPLRKILEPGEAVFYLARAPIMPGKLQRYTQGTQSRYLFPATLIFTNRRLLHLSLQWNGQWDRNVRSAQWGDVKEAHVIGRFRGKLHIEYRQGSKETYWRIPKRAVQKLKVLVPILLSASVGETSPALSMASFCPKCLAALTPGVYRCGRCGLKFRNEKMLLPHALLIPGGAYFHVGLNLFGAAHAFVDIAILSSLIVWALAALGRVQPHVAGGAPATRTTYSLVTAFLASALVFDLCLGIRIARIAIRNFIPKS